MSSLFFLYTILALTDIFCTRILFYSPTDRTDEHGFYHADVFFEHEICRRPTDQREVIARISRIFLAHGWMRMDTDLPCGWVCFEHEYHSNIFGHTDRKRILPCGWCFFLNTNFSHESFWHTDESWWTRILPCGWWFWTRDLSKTHWPTGSNRTNVRWWTLKRRTNWSSPL